jgi:hypothetical protein
LGVLIRKKVERGGSDYESHSINQEFPPAFPVVSGLETSYRHYIAIQSMLL